VAKLGLPVGIDVDVTGLRRMGRDATAELEKLRGATNRIGSSINAAMALPMIGFLSNVMSAHAEARKIQADLMFPFSHKMHEAQISADLRKMQLGQRMVGAGMDAPAARSITMEAEREMISGLMAQQRGSTLGRALESFIEAPGTYASNIVKGLEGGAQYLGAVGSELFGGNMGPLNQLLHGTGNGRFEDPANRAAAELGLTRMQAGLAVAGGQTEQFEGLRMQLERQTYILGEIEANSRGKR
jgi:hypothetical protein